MSGIRHFYPAVLVASFLGIMLLNDANRRRVAEQRQQLRSRVERGQRD